MAIRERSDAGQPIVASDPQSMHARLYKNIADLVWAGLSEDASARKGPNIVIE